jgi:outer membrane protein OmpA-like peptidoglycan-associated protein
MARARDRESERRDDRGREPAAPPARRTSAPETILDLQRAAGNAAVAAALQRAPAKRPSGPKGKDDQEQSWANPSRGVASTPALVGTIYFKTKESFTDAQDDAVLRQIAKAYAPWATRNARQKGGDKGLRGRIVGYADPRHSTHPDNLELSAARADIVERRLNRFLVDETASSGLIPRDFDFDKEAGGVAAADPEADLGAEEMSLGWMRRAEIYIEGQAAEPEPPAQDIPPPPEPVKPPDDGWERWVPYIQKCDGRITEGVAMQVLAYLAGWGKLVRQSFDYTGRLPIMIPTPGLPSGPKGKDTSPDIPGPAITYGKHGGVLPFTPKKPSWWDGRKSGYPSQYLGRQALSPKAVKCRQLSDKALMLIADMRRVNEYIDATVTHSTSAYVMFMAELRKDEPDVAKLREYAVPIEELMFIWDATLAASIEVGQLARDI